MAHLEVYPAAEPRSTVSLEDVPADGVGFADYIVGRSPEVWLTLDKDQNVSRLHAKLSPIGSRWAIEDLGARNGTWVNGDRTVGMHVLRDGDEIRIGATCVVFRDPLLAGESTTVKPGPRPDITPKEREALVALCRPIFSANLVKKAGSRREMAGEMYVGQAAVQMHLTNLYRKFLIPEDANDKRDLLAIAVIEAGVIGHGDYVRDDSDEVTG
jgi:FHA domain